MFSFSDKTTNKCEQASHLMNLVVAALLILSHTLPHRGQFNLDPPVIKKCFLLITDISQVKFQFSRLRKIFKSFKIFHAPQTAKLELKNQGDRYPNVML